MFVIQDVETGYYFNAKGKIIIFDTEREAAEFLQGFHNYSIKRALSENGFDPETFFMVEHVMSVLHIVEIDFDISSVTTISVRELR